MAKQIEDELKIQNWLSIVTFDTFKYALLGGNVEIEATEKGLVITLLGVNENSVGINKKFSRLLLESSQEEPTP